MRFKNKFILFVFLFLITTNLSFASSVTYNASGVFTVPAGVTSVTVKVVGGGGGGGGMRAGSCGDSVSGGGGGSGGYLISSLSVTPGSIMPVTVGLGGSFGDVWWCGTRIIPGGSGGPNGATGGSSQFGSLLATGGAGGISSRGSTPGVIFGISGAGGSPGGVAGGPISPSTAGNCNTPSAGGNNGSGYGLGGLGEGLTGCNTWHILNGGNGVVILTWLPPPTVNLWFSFLDKGKSSLENIVAMIMDWRVF